MDDRQQLGNGLTVILRQQHGSPVVAFQAWVGVGSADEPEALAGIAHVFEHMLFKGTARRGVGKIAQEVESAGGDINAWTSFDQTVYHLVLASRHFDVGLDIVTDALRNSAFDPDELASELKVVLEEVKQGEDNPGRVVTQGLFSTAYARHTYRRPVIGYSRTVEKFQRKGLLEFFKRHYVPNNITLVVVGDFPLDEARKKIAAAWKTAKRKPLSSTRPRPEPAQLRSRALVSGADVSEVHLVAGFHIPGLVHADTAALDCAAILLGQGDSSRLQVEVKHNAHKVSDCYAYSFTPRDPGLLVVGATLPPKDVDGALEALLGEAYRMTREEVSDEELEKAKTIIESDAVYQKETVQGMARKLGFFQTVAGSITYEEEYFRRTRAVTPALIKETLARYLRPENASLSVLLPQAMVKGDQEKIGEIGERLLKRAALSSERSSKKSKKAASSGEAASRSKKSSPGKGAPEVVSETLPNGTRLILLRDPSVALLAARAVWVGGLRDEDASNNGINNLISVLLTRGTRSRSGEQIAHEVESIAGSVGGFSGRNSFGIRAELLSRHTERGLEVLADCLLDAQFPEGELEHERKQVLEEIRTQEDNVSSVAFRMFTQELYRRHPYRMDHLGTPSSVASLTRPQIVDYYKSRFSPARMSMAMVGDFDPDRMIRFVEQLIDRRAGEFAPRQVPVDESAVREEEIRAPRRVSRVLNKQQAHLVIGFPGATLGSPDRFALEVLTTVLSGQGGRLFVELREKKGLAYRVSAFSLEGLDPGYVAVYVACSPENLPVAEAGILTELKKLVDNPVPRAELARVKQYLAGSHDISLQRRGTVASTLSFNEAYGLGYAQYLRYSPSILAVTAEDVTRVARAYLDPRRAVTALVSPGEAAVADAPAVPLARVARAPSSVAASSRKSLAAQRK